MSIASSVTTASAPVLPSVSVLNPLPLTSVSLAAGFWGNLQTLNREAIIPHAASWVKKLGWVENFERAATGEEYTHRGREFADTEIYKLIEAISWDHSQENSEGLNELLDEFVEKLGAAQDPDGYLHTLFGRPWQQPRYSDFKWGHELYCFGHLIQAGVANYRATGNDKLLNISRRVADHVCIMFGPEGLNKVCGHAEIEPALVELYRITGERRYLDQASVFIERRGTGTLPLFEFGQAYWQDDMPVRAATILRGHAVRALYLAAGAVDVAVETQDTELLEALKLQWDNTVARRTYITGGMGSHHMDEAFGEDFVLPPDRSYCETCAGVASIMFSWRLLLATGEAKYADLIERTLFNIVATSPASDGRSFFYANTLHQRVEGTPAPLNEDGVCIRGGASRREAWYEVSCCPPNVARTLASLGGYLATSTNGGVQIHQYAAGRVECEVAGEPLVLDIATNYPDSGLISITIVAAPATPVAISLRVPEWADGATISENGGDQMAARPGTVAIERAFTPGETLNLELPMQPRISSPDGRIDAVRGCVAIERGPEIFALESVDLPSGWDLEQAEMDLSEAPRYTEGTVRVLMRQRTFQDSPWPVGPEGNGRTSDHATRVDLVRYHSWAERGPSTMRIWIPAATS